MTYKECEEAVYNQLVEWREAYGWHFSLRQKAAKGAEYDRFIGTEKSGYFRTTFWHIPNSYPGNSSDTVDVLFEYSSSDDYHYKLELNHTRDPKGEQNELVLEFVENLRQVEHPIIGRAEPTKTDTKHERILIPGHKASYAKFGAMADALLKDLNIFIPFIDQQLSIAQKNQPALEARRLNEDDTNKFEARYTKRIKRYRERIDQKAGQTTKLTEEQWYRIIQNPLLIRPKDIDVLVAFYRSPNHENGSWQIDAILKEIPESEGLNITVNSAVYRIAERINKSFDGPLQFAPRGDGSLQYWNLLFTGELKEGRFPWKMRPELVRAMSRYLSMPGFPPMTPEKHMLNQILYGPPGTGKTYSTITRAVAIVEDKSLDAVTEEDRQEVLRRFRKYQEAGRIAFTTFHQSLSYEDFVEGLKPVLGEEDKADDGQVRYTIKRGVFRNACDAALRSILKKRPSESTRTVLDFDRKYELLAERVEAQLLETAEYKLESRNGGTVLVDDISTQGNFRIKHENGSRVYTVGKERLTRLHLGLLERGEEVSNIHDTFRDIIGGSNSSAYWAVLNAVRKFEPEYTTREIEVETTPSKDVLATLTREDYRQPDLDRHVLIIDEINRGNVSAILGELITLLEPNKRLGAKEELKVTLPYSRDTFGVPPNLHIIGTMNTADRSVEALDAALRRRFVFREVKPDPEVIRTVLGESVAIKVTDELTVDLGDLLDLLNQRIAVLRDIDHQLGHSYFLNITDWQGLCDALVDRIVPLLREYFFADPGQLQLVVGNEFCQRGRASAVKFGTPDDKDALETDNLYTYTFPKPNSKEQLAKFIWAMNYNATLEAPRDVSPLPRRGAGGEGSE